MKAKHVFATLGLTFVMGLGVGASLLNAAPLQQANAEMVSWYVVGSFDGDNKWSHTSGYAMTETSTDVWVKENLHFKVGDEFKVCDEEDKNWQGGWSYNNGASNPKTYFTAANDGANIVCATEGDYNITFTKSDWHIKVDRVDAVTKYSVNVYVDGVLRGVEEVDEGTLPAEPALTVYAKTFNGWYSNSDCSGTKVTGITSDTTVYGEIIDAPQWSYSVDASRVSTTFANKYLYAFESNDRHNAAWPGVEMDGDSFIVPSDATIIINNGGLAQTVNVTQSFVGNDVLRILNEKDGADHYECAWVSQLDEPAEDGYYLVGSEIGWQYDDAIKMTFNNDYSPLDGDGNIAVLMNVAMVENEEIKVRSFIDEVDAWYSCGSVDTAWGETQTNGNWKALAAGNYDIYFKDSTFYVAQHYVEPEYTIKINDGSALTLTHNEGTEYKYENVDLSAGQQITVYADGVEITGMLPKAIRNNNMQNNAFNKVLVDAEDADIYVDVSAKTIWISGMVTGGYHILKNGHELVQMTPTDDYEGFKQYCSALLTFAADDTVEFIDAERTDHYDTLPVIFHIETINAGGLGENFELVDNVITCKTACQASVYMKLKSGLDEVYFGQVEQYIADATAFAEGFNSAIGAVCKNDGSTVRSDLETAWAAQATAFAALSEQAQDAVKEGQLSSVEAIRNCAAKYESVYRLRKLGSGWTLADFLDMQLSSRTIGLSVNANNTILLVVVISSVAIIASLGLTFYFLRKRKYSK